MRTCLRITPRELTSGLLFKEIRSLQSLGRRSIRISTIPSGTFDDLPSEAPDISNAVTPGIQHLWLYQLIQC